MPYNLTIECPQCKKRYIPELLIIDPQKFLTAYINWNSGVKIQRAFPASQSWQREQLQTGICSNDCWDKFLGPER